MTHVPGPFTRRTSAKGLPDSNDDIVTWYMQTIKDIAEDNGVVSSDWCTRRARGMVIIV